jgi:hypothetical protein
MKGTSYEYRYRGINVNGSGGWSPIGYLTAAQSPDRPPAPEYGSSTSTSITLLFSPTLDDGGSIITKIILEMATFEASIFAEVSTYTDNLMSHVLTQADDGLVTGSKYRFRLKSQNVFGTSRQSEEIILTCNPLPSQPSSITKN